MKKCAIFESWCYVMRTAVKNLKYLKYKRNNVQLAFVMRILIYITAKKACTEFFI